MQLTRQITRTLDDEHRPRLALLARLARALPRGPASELASLARPLLRQIDTEVTQHFGFE